MNWDQRIESALTWPFRKILEKAISYNTVNVDWYARNGYPELYAMHGGGEQSYSGKSVTVGSALNHSVVWACQRILAETVGSLPLHLYRRLDGDAKEKARDRNLYSLLHDAPNSEMGAVEFREIMMSHVAMQGNAYSKIIRQASGRIVALMPPIDPRAVTPERVKGSIFYRVRTKEGKEDVYPMSEVFHVRGLGYDGLAGYSVVEMARNSIGNALAVEEYTGKFYKNGGRTPYLLKHPSKFKDDEQFKEFRKKWEEIYNEPHRAPILENGLEYQQIGLKPEDSQFLETRQFNVPEICRWFRMPPHLVGDLSRATFANIEHQSIEFVQYTLTPWLRKWESAIARCLLGPTEGKRYFAEFDVDGLLRGDSKARSEYLLALHNGGMATSNEGRAKLNMNPSKDKNADKLFVQPGMIPLEKAGEDQGGNDGNENGQV